MSGIDDIGRLVETLRDIRANIGTKPRGKWYVDSSNGNDNYDGLSPLSAFHSIGAAVTAADDGDVIHIAEDTYDEAISIPAGKNGLQIICEPGVYLINTTPGTVVAIASAVVYWEGGIIETNGQIGMDINGEWFHGKNIRVYNCTNGFDINAAHYLLENCHTTLTATAGFDISEDHGIVIECSVHGDAASRGFYLSHTNAEDNRLIRCSTLGCTASGYECVAGADNNIFDDCSQSDLCAGPTDAGTNNSWVGHKATGTKGLCVMDFWSDMVEEVVVTGAQVTTVLSTITVADLPTLSVVVRAILMFKFRMVENTFAGVNMLDAAAPLPLQVDDGAGVGYVTAIDFVDNAFALAASIREGGDVIIGDNDVAARVDGNDTYPVRWLNAKADQNNIQFNDCQFGLRIWYRPF